MRKMLDEKLARFEELERMMSDPAIQIDSNRMAAVAREHGRGEEPEEGVGEYEEGWWIDVGDDRTEERERRELAREESK